MSPRNNPGSTAAMQLNGELSKVSLPNLVQLVKNGELTGKITLMQGAKAASLFVELGDVVHVDIDGFAGREAFFELFLWVTGSFSFVEGELGSAPRTLNPSDPEDSLDRLLREGLSYLEQKKYLEQLRITGDTILQMTDRIRELVAQSKSNPRLAAALKMIDPIIQRIDGTTPLSVALKELQLSRRAYAQSLAIILAEGLATVVEKPTTERGESIDLPAWVIARLKQDDTDLTQSIIDMVIWVDRVKCWMYQADVDFARILENLTGTAPAMWHDDEFFRELNSGAIDYQGPLFGESAVPERTLLPSADDGGTPSYSTGSGDTADASSAISVSKTQTSVDQTSVDQTSVNNTRDAVTQPDDDIKKTFQAQPTVKPGAQKDQTAKSVEF